jgi:hypothetical protein
MKKLAPLTFLVAFVALSIGAAASKPSDKKDDGKASLSLRATPAMAFAPARITLSGQLKGTASDSETFYCPTIQWNWGDGTISESSSDCEPFQPSKSDIQKSFTTQHIYKSGGLYEVKLLLKKADRIVAIATATLNIGKAIGEGDGDDIIR